MEREIIRVEPIDSNFERWGAPVSTCTRAGNMVFVSGMPPFDPDTGEILANAPFERQVELILTQVKKALEAAGSDLDHVLKCNVMCISADRFKASTRSTSAFSRRTRLPASSSACRSGRAPSTSRSTVSPSRGLTASAACFGGAQLWADQTAEPGHAVEFLFAQRDAALAGALFVAEFAIGVKPVHDPPGVLR